MKGILGVSLLILLMPSAYAAELPGDSAEGKRLHDANCMACHDTGIYTRKDRLVYLNDQFYQCRWRLTPPIAPPVTAQKATLSLMEIF